MSLLGWPLLMLLGVLTVLLPVATFWWWRRTPHPAGRIPHTLARILLIVGSQLAAVAFVGAAVNDYGYFYSSWSEVLGAATQNATITSHAGAAKKPSPIPRPTTPTKQAVPGVTDQLSILKDPGWSTEAEWSARRSTIWTPRATCI